MGKVQSKVTKTKKTSTSNSISPSNSQSSVTSQSLCSSRSPSATSVRSDFYANGESAVDGFDAMMRRLATETRFARFELNQIYASYRKDCSIGEITKSQFLSVYDRLYPNGDSHDYASLVFNAFDVDGSGTVNFEEFVLGLSAVFRGSWSEKMAFAFRIHDVDRNGYVDKKEMLQTLTSLYRMLGPEFAFQRKAPCESVECLFKSLDHNGDGVLTKDEFMSANSEERQCEVLELLEYIAL